MASTQSKLFTILLRLINKKRFLSKQLAEGKFDNYNCPEPPRQLLKHCHIHKTQLNGQDVFTLTPKSGDGSSRHILYLHGGAYVQGFNKFHWYFLTELVTRTNCTITAPDYPLAPGNTYKEAFSMVMALYHQLRATTSASEMILMGDSSGGGFALALAQKIRCEQEQSPGQLILLFPWLDITLTNPDIAHIDPVDPSLHAESLRKAGHLFAGNTSPDYYLLSPIYGSIEGLGRIAVFGGSKDILVADIRKLKSLAASKQIELDYYEYPDMFHGWIFLNLPESKKARQQIVDLIMSA